MEIEEVVILIQKPSIYLDGFFICVKVLKNLLLFKKHVYICLTNLKKIKL